jgi:hypothetical protein
VAAFFVLGVLLQVFLAGVGVFGINARKVTNASSFDPHRAWGSALMVVSIILLILALIAWQSLSTVLSTFVLALLVVGRRWGWPPRGTATSGSAERTPWMAWSFCCSRCGWRSWPGGAGRARQPRVTTEKRILITVRNGLVLSPDN